MRIEQIELKNCMCFGQLNLTFSPTHKVTVILGDQGSGKTAILRQIYHALTWFAGRYKDPRTAGVVMPDADIRRGQRQSKISVSVRIHADIASLPESPDAQTQDRQLFTWHLWKTLNANGTGLSQVDTAQLDALGLAYQQAQQKDPLIAAPLIAYYPTDRLITDISLISKNNPAVLHAHAAYDMSSIAFCNFARFFEWFREISDIEHAQQAQFIQGLTFPNTPAQLEDDAQATTANNAKAVDASMATDTQLPDHNLQHDPQHDWQQRVQLAQSQLQQRCLSHLNALLNQVFPEIEALYVQYQPKLELMVRREGQVWGFQQLPNSLKVGISLLGDVFRRACLLHPHSAFPHLEAEGILLIDQVDALLDSHHSSEFLQRLQLVFPHLQIVVTGQQRELIEHGEQWQCLQLQQGQLHHLNLNAIQQQWHGIYDQLLQTPTVDMNEPMQLNAATSTTADIQQLWTQIQALSPEQLTELKALMDNDAPSAQDTSV